MKFFRGAAALSLALMLAGTACAGEIDVKVSTFSVYESKFGNYEAKIVTPIFTGLAIDDYQRELNDSLMARGRKTAAQYEAEVGEMMNDKMADGGHLGVTLSYDVRVDNEKLLTVDLYELTIVGSSSTTHTFYNFDKKTGLPVELSSFFNGKADYVKIISDYIRGEMRRLNKKGEGPFWIAPQDSGGFSSIKPNQNFFVNDKGNIVICFDKYEVAPGAAGSPEFEIPRRAVAPWLKKN
ncbi:MAG: RsiV family protein [Synergistaceae bacterium]|nr:RsiV family protein [Synergistaceae bacterium]